MWVSSVYNNTKHEYWLSLLYFSSMLLMLLLLMQMQLLMLLMCSFSVMQPNVGALTSSVIDAEGWLFLCHIPTLHLLLATYISHH